MKRMVCSIASLLVLSMLFLALGCSVPGGEEASIGSGPGFKTPLGIAVEADNSLAGEYSMHP